MVAVNILCPVSKEGLVLSTEAWIQLGCGAASVLRSDIY